MSSSLGVVRSMPAADAGLDEFFDAWQQALTVIGTNIENVPKKLGVAAEHYEEVDNHACLLNP